MSGRYAQIEAAVKCSAIYQDLKTSKTYVDGWQSTIYKAYFSGLCQGISPQNMAKKCQKYGTFTYLHLLDPEDLPSTQDLTMAKNPIFIDYFPINPCIFHGG